MPEPRPIHRPTAPARPLALFAATLAGLGILTMSLIGLLRESRTIEAEHLRQAQALARHVATLTETGVAANDVAALGRVLESFDSFPALRRLVVTDRQERILASVSRNPRGALAPDDRQPLDASDPAHALRAPIGPIAPTGWVHLILEPPPAQPLPVAPVLWLLVTSTLAAALGVPWLLRRSAHGSAGTDRPPAPPSRSLAAPRGTGN